MQCHAVQGHCGKLLVSPEREINSSTWNWHHFMLAFTGYGLKSSSTVFTWATEMAEIFNISFVKLPGLVLSFIYLIPTVD